MGCGVFGKHSQILNSRLALLLKWCTISAHCRWSPVGQKSGATSCKHRERDTGASFGALLNTFKENFGQPNEPRKGGWQETLVQDMTVQITKQKRNWVGHVMRIWPMDHLTRDGTRSTGRPWKGYERLNISLFELTVKTFCSSPGF